MPHSTNGAMAMGLHCLSMLFAPKSVAVIGTSVHPESVGGIMFRNMPEGGYRGELCAINPKHLEVRGRRAYASIERLCDLLERVTFLPVVPYQRSLAFRVTCPWSSIHLQHSVFCLGRFQCVASTG